MAKEWDLLYERLSVTNWRSMVGCVLSGQTQCSMKRSWHQDGTCLRKTVRNKMALSGRSHQVQVRRCASTSISALHSDPLRWANSQSEWLAPLHFPQKDWHRQVWFQHFRSKTIKTCQASEVCSSTCHKAQAVGFAKWLRHQISIEWKTFACTADLHKHPSKEGFKRHNKCLSHPQHGDSSNSVATDFLH